jgi:AraC-like DNA-binding protein
MPWAEAESALRAALAALGAFVALLSGFALRARPAARALAALVALCTGAYAICTGEAFAAPAAPQAAAIALLFLCAALPAAFWAFVNVWFDDEFAVDARVWLAVALTGALGLAAAERLGWTASAAGAFGLARRAIAIALVTHALYALWRGRQSDLVDERISARRAAAWIAGAYVIGVLMVELWLGGAPVPAQVQAANLAAIWLVTAGTAIALTRWDLREPVVQTGAPRAAAAAPPSADDKLLAALERAMRGERLYRQEGLTIAQLARRLGTQEHRLRRAINRGLGYRNFNEFLHRYRLEEVAGRLKSAEDAHLPILTLALEAGYASIGPFNRAFKARYGVTPSAYRAP